ncbi:MAG: sugar transferase [Lachnospiraceae bacterium]|nr:sugar transferase [Lachnospiraceae bacterium]
MYRREKQSWLKHLDFTIFDIICTQLAFIIAYRLRIGPGSGLPYANDLYERLAVIMVLLQICVIFFAEPYKDILRRNKVQELKKTIINCSMTALTVILYIYVAKMGEVYSRMIIGLMWVVSVPICYAFRLFWKDYVRKSVVDNKNRSVMVLLTNNDMVESCIRDFERDRYRNYVIKGIVIMDADRKGDVIRDVPVVANVDDFMDYIRTNVVDEVFVNGDSIEASKKLSDELLEMGVTVHFKLMHDTSLAPTKVIEKYGDYMVLTSSMNIASPRQVFLKRATDILGSVVGLILTFVAFLIFAPIIKLQSPGPVFFKQRRVGKNGRRFWLYKFRSMYADAEARKQELMAQNKMNGNMFKLENDPRITPIGRFMRKYSIDELPQFWNVLKGEMSLVGTRPPTEDEFKQYEAHHRARLGIKPGLTGMWQVSGRSNITDFEEVVALDTQYISNWNLGMDFRILVRTVLVVLKGSGAA